MLGYFGYNTETAGASSESAPSPVSPAAAPAAASAEAPLPQVVAPATEAPAAPAAEQVTAVAEEPAPLAVAPAGKPGLMAKLKLVKQRALHPKTAHPEAFSELSVRIEALRVKLEAEQKSLDAAVKRGEAIAGQVDRYTRSTEQCESPALHAAHLDMSAAVRAATTNAAISDALARVLRVQAEMRQLDFHRTFGDRARRKAVAAASPDSAAFAKRSAHARSSKQEYAALRARLETDMQDLLAAGADKRQTRTLIDALLSAEFALLKSMRGCLTDHHTAEGERILRKACKGFACSMAA
jgi:hypothetical protein